MPTWERFKAVLKALKIYLDDVPGDRANTSRSLHSSSWARRVVLVGIACIVAPNAEARALDVHLDMFTEGTAIPFTRLAGNSLNPGGGANLEWRWLDREAFDVFQTAQLMAFFHDTIERGLLVGTEVGLRGTTPVGLAMESGLGAGYLHAFSGSPIFAKDESGSYVQTRDWGRPRFAPTLHVGVGYDLSRRTDVPLAIFLKYGSFMEIPYSSTQFPVLPHVTLGTSLRYTFRGKEN